MVGVRKYYKRKAFPLITVCLIGVVLLVFGNACGDPPAEVCIIVDPFDCPGASSQTNLHLTHKTVETRYAGNYWDPGLNQWRWRDENYPFPGGIPYEAVKEKERVVSSASNNETTIIRYVEGYEINYGFWSKDSYRIYTWEEMFEWKYGRKPTQQEADQITEQQVRDWFNERHTVNRSWPLPDDPPRDVRVITPPIKRYCFNPGSDVHEFDGYIRFANGTTCEISPNPTKIDEKFDASNNPNIRYVKIKKPCAGC